VAAAVPGVTSAVNIVRGLTTSTSRERFPTESPPAPSSGSPAEESRGGGGGKRTLVVAASFRQVSRRGLIPVACGVIKPLNSFSRPSTLP
jgi:hypothetical protein